MWQRRKSVWPQQRAILTRNQRSIRAEVTRMNDVLEKCSWFFSSHWYNDHSIWTCEKSFGTTRRFWSLIFFWFFYRIVHRFIFDSGWSTNTKFNTTRIHQSNQWYEQRNGSSMEKRSTSENVENRHTSLSNFFFSIVIWQVSLLDFF